MIALFIGRFQPFHSGHLSVIEKMQSDPGIEKIVIGVGSAQYSDTPENPFTFAMRKEMIFESIKNILVKPFSIIAVPDIHNPPFWVEHVKKTVGDFDLVYTGNDFVRDLFLEKKFVVRPIAKDIAISATELRALIENKQSAWEKFVPTPVIRIIKKYGQTDKN